MAPSSILKLVVIFVFIVSSSIALPNNRTREPYRRRHGPYRHSWIESISRDCMLSDPVNCKFSQEKAARVNPGCQAVLSNCLYTKNRPRDGYPRRRHRPSPPRQSGWDSISSECKFSDPRNCKFSQEKAARMNPICQAVLTSCQYNNGFFFQSPI